jgi:hypothetical protein
MPDLIFHGLRFRPGDANHFRETRACDLLKRVDDKRFALIGQESFGPS